MKTTLRALVGMCMIVGMISVYSGPSQATSRGADDPFDTDEGAIYLDPSRDIIIDELTNKIYTVGWDTTYVPDDYSMLIYPGQDIEALDLDNGNPTAVGMHAISVGMTVPASTNDWYKLVLVLRGGASAIHNDLGHQWFLSADGPFGTVDAIWYWSSYPSFGTADTKFFGMGNGTAGLPSIFPDLKGTQTWVGWINETPLGRPWQTSDFGTGWGMRLDAWYDQVETWNMWAQYMYAVLIPTTAPEIITGNQILRPDSDLNWDEMDDWWTGTPDTVNFYENINEETLGSDNSTSYIWADNAWEIMFGFTDPSPDLNTAASFNLTLWIICRSDGFYTSERDLHIGLTTGNDIVLKRDQVITTEWHNFTFDYSFNPGTGLPWTWDELVELKVMVGGTFGMNITQIGVILEDTNYIGPGEGEDGGTSFIGWIKAGGVITMLGLLGFFGLIAVPTLMVVSYHGGEDIAEIMAKGIFFLGLFGGLLISSVMLSI